jgi:beta-fructofuranosidase
MKHYLLLVTLPILVVSLLLVRCTTITPVEAYRDVVSSKDKAVYAKAALELRQWMIANDPHRPVYHFTGPESWINDPNGVIYHRGMYHLFYQYDPIVNGKRSERCWGHAVSKDLVHWEDWPVALWPDTQYDRKGVYSGNLVIDDNGIPTALYTGNVSGNNEAYGMLARSFDGFLTWEKKMVMHNDQRPTPESPVHWDAQIWKDGDTWYQLIGGTKQNEGAAYIWSSSDLQHWIYHKAIFSGPPSNFWELPYLVPFGEKYALFIGRCSEFKAGNPYWIGNYDKKSLTFHPDQPKSLSIDNGHYYSFNFNMKDDKGSGGKIRQLMHGWILLPPSPSKTVPYWQGAHSIPRVIRLEDKRIWQAPIPEIRNLRGKKFDFRNLQKQDLLRDIEGDVLEIKATFIPEKAEVFGIKLRVSEDGTKFSRIYFESATCKFGVDGQMNKNPWSKEPLPIVQKTFLQVGEPVQMHIFLDRSIIEVYINGCALTVTTFPEPPAQGLAIFSEGGDVKLEALEVWEMKSMWE